MFKRVRVYIYDKCTVPQTAFLKIGLSNFIYIYFFTPISFSIDFYYSHLFTGIEWFKTQTMNVFALRIQQNRIGVKPLHTISCFIFFYFISFTFILSTAPLSISGKNITGTFSSYSNRSHNFFKYEKISYIHPI